MTKRHKPKRKPIATYRFTSPLHMDAAIKRLKSELKGEYSPLHGYIHLSVAHEELRDSHCFEVHRLGSKWLPERLVIGDIRQLDDQTSLVECEIKIAQRHLPAFEYAAVGVLIAAILTTLNGSAIREMVILLWALLGIATFGVVWLRRRLRKRRDPLVSRIQSILTD